MRAHFFSINKKRSIEDKCKKKTEVKLVENQEPFLNILPDLQCTVYLNIFYIYSHPAVQQIQCLLSCLKSNGNVGISHR